MKQLIAIILAILVLLPSMTKFRILIDFKVNQDFIAAVFCVNKDKPTMNCDGQCYLSKQLKEAEKEDPVTPNSKTEKLELIFCLKSDLNYKSTRIVYNEAYRSIPFLSSFYHYNYLSDIFHPPNHRLV